MLCAIHFVHPSELATYELISPLLWLSFPFRSPQSTVEFPVLCYTMTQWTWAWVNSGSWWWTGSAVHGVTKSQTRLSDWTEPRFSLLIYFIHTISSIYVNSHLPVHPIAAFPPWCPYIWSLHLCLYFCFANKIIQCICLDFTYMCCCCC